MTKLRFVKGTKYENTCAYCGKLIPKGSDAFWNGEKSKESSKNYHEACGNAINNANATPQNDKAITGSSSPSSTAVPELPESWNEEENWQHCAKFIEGKYGEIKGHSTEISELMAERYGTWMNKKILKEKRGG